MPVSINVTWVKKPIHNPGTKKGLPCFEYYRGLSYYAALRFSVALRGNETNTDKKLRELRKTPWYVRQRFNRFIEYFDQDGDPCDQYGSVVDELFKVQVSARGQKSGKTEVDHHFAGWPWVGPDCPNKCRMKVTLGASLSLLKAFPLRGTEKWPDFIMGNGLIFRILPEKGETVEEAWKEGHVQLDEGKTSALWSGPFRNPGFEQMAFKEIDDFNQLKHPNGHGVRQDYEYEFEIDHCDTDLYSFVDLVSPGPQHRGIVTQYGEPPPGAVVRRRENWVEWPPETPVDGLKARQGTHTGSPTGISEDDEQELIDPWQPGSGGRHRILGESHAELVLPTPLSHRSHLLDAVTLIDPGSSEAIPADAGEGLL